MVVGVAEVIEGQSAVRSELSGPFQGLDCVAPPGLAAEIDAPLGQNFGVGRPLPLIGDGRRVGCGARARRSCRRIVRRAITVTVLGHITHASAREVSWSIQPRYFAAP